MISALRKVIPSNIRIAAYIVIIAGFVTMVDLLIQAFLTTVSAKISAKFAYLMPEPEVKKPARKSAPKSEDDGEVVAAIAAAIHYSQTH